MKYLDEIINRLKAKYGENLSTELKHRNDVELFVSVLLSPQNTDKQVNKVTKELFKHFKTFNDYANANLKELYKFIKSLNYYKHKAKYIKESSKIIIENFNGKIPNNIDELMLLPGVGRKVANVILNELYNLNYGIVVDTHVNRVANRLGLVNSRDPLRVERQLMNIVPKKYWHDFSHWLIRLGRDTCNARNPKCNECILNDICPNSRVR